MQRSQPQPPQQLTPQKNSSPVDQLDLSSAASGVNRLDGAIAGGGEIRIDRVAEIRRQIADGSYETPEKLEAALDRMLDQFA
ncbi:flagellar biosynthesis anti-sigma factor FlgM [Novipirellula artificiosorum]|uniref:flagellar biosynthesis anti-sigma factor FlgM n=1 Tax=Novipirellula artificiosorum TaxID=2528016 RepID=UPI001E36E16F|nr:flagellar biosynthesis anti-sigma factor FlgM [Novipirellula artificiosorum]